jgi:hypothetical protein
MPAQRHEARSTSPRSPAGQQLVGLPWCNEHGGVRVTDSRLSAEANDVRVGQVAACELAAHEAVVQHARAVAERADELVWVTTNAISADDSLHCTRPINMTLPTASP